MEEGPEEELNNVLRATIYQFAAGNVVTGTDKGKSSEKEALQRITNIIAGGDKRLKLDDITENYQNEKFLFTPLFWAGVLKLNSIAEGLLDASKKGKITIDFEKFDIECEKHKGLLEKDFINHVNAARGKGPDELLKGLEADAEQEYQAAPEDYTQYKNWNIHAGFNPEVYQTLMAQLAKRGESQFALDRIYSVSPPEVSYSTPEPPLRFSTNDDQKNVFYFTPVEIGFNSYVKKEEFSATENPQVNRCLNYINACCPLLDKKTRFIIPLFEKPGPGTAGISHSILMCVDFDPESNTLTPVVYDSIYRGIIDYVGKFWTWQQHKTCDALLQTALEKIIEQMTVKPLTRYSYGHQNRATEGNCGAYTFRLAHLAANEFNTLDTPDELFKRIPTPNGWITADNFLTPEHVAEITRVVQADKGFNREALKTLPNTEIKPKEANVPIETLMEKLFIQEPQYVEIVKKLFEKLDVILNRQSESLDKYYQALLNSSKMAKEAYQEFYQKAVGELGDGHPVLLAMQLLQGLKNLKEIRNPIISEIIIEEKNDLFPAPFEELPLEKYPTYQETCKELNNLLSELKIDIKLGIEEIPLTEDQPAVKKYQEQVKNLSEEHPMHASVKSDEPLPDPLPPTIPLYDKLDDKTALDLAVELYKHEKVKELSSSLGDATTLILAARLDNREDVSTLLNKSNINLGQQDIWGKTAFHYLVEKNNEEGIKKFIGSILPTVNAKDITDLPDNNEESALHIIARAGHMNLLTLLDSGFTRQGVPVPCTLADFFPQSLNQKNQDGLTPIEIARQNGHTQIVKLLAKRMQLAGEEKQKYGLLETDEYEEIEVISDKEKRPQETNEEQELRKAAKKEEKIAKKNRVFELTLGGLALVSLSATMFWAGGFILATSVVAGLAAGIAVATCAKIYNDKVTEAGRTPEDRYLRKVNQVNMKLKEIENNEDLSEKEKACFNRYNALTTIYPNLASVKAGQKDKLAIKEEELRDFEDLLHQPSGKRHEKLAEINDKISLKFKKRDFG